MAVPNDSAAMGSVGVARSMGGAMAYAVAVQEKDATENAVATR